KQGQYYANRANDFWRIIGVVLSRDVSAMSYDERLAVLKSAHIGLWDAYHNCVRPRSLDSDISDAEPNDFAVFKAATPTLRLVCFNGKKAGEYECWLRNLGYETCVLPSSSAANRTDSAARLHLWKSKLRLS